MMDNAVTDQIQNPVVKAVTSLAAGGASSVVSQLVDSPSFFPTTFAGWAAAVSAIVAMTYTLHLLGEWYWKKVIHPFLQRRRNHDDEAFKASGG